MNKQEPSPNQVKLTLWIIWGALLSAIIVYGIVLRVVVEPGDGSVSKTNDSLVVAVAAAGVMGLLVSIFIRLKITRPLARKLAPEELIKVLPSCIISWALAESVAIFGLVLGMTGHPVSIYGTFFVTGFVAMVFLAPRFAPLIRIVPDK